MANAHTLIERKVTHGVLGENAVTYLFRGTIVTAGIDNDDFVLMTAEELANLELVNGRFFGRVTGTVGATGDDIRVRWVLDLDETATDISYTLAEIGIAAVSNGFNRYIPQGSATGLEYPGTETGDISAVLIGNIAADTRITLQMDSDDATNAYTLFYLIHMNFRDLGI